MIHLVTCIRHPASGFRCDPEHLDQQRAALNSWAAIGACVHILARPGHVLWADLAEELRRHPVAAQVDSDILLLPEVVRVFDFIGSRDGPAWATSHRREFPPSAADPVREAAPYHPPWGLSIFVGNKAFWEDFRGSKACGYSKLGVGDDNAVCSFGNKHHLESGFDFSLFDCVFHPDHGGRIQNRGEFNLDRDADLTHCWIPGRKVPE